MRTILIASAVGLLVAAFFAGCGNSDALPDLGGDDGGAADLSAPPDLAPPRRDPTDHPPLFHLDHQGGPVLDAIELHTVVWQGDEALGAKVDTFHQAMVSSTYWTDRLKEYGIGNGAGKGVLVIPGAAPATIDDSGLSQLVIQNVAAGTWPQPNANTVFAFIVPPTTTVDLYGAKGCESFGGYHSETSTRVPYIVNLQCDDAFESLTIVASHEAAECATDPHTSSQPGWYTDGAGEIADVCVGSGYQLGSYTVTRLYSNEVAKLGNVDPCGPNPPGLPFFSAALAPSAIDVVTDTNGKGSATVMLQPFAYGAVGKMQWEILINLGLDAPGVTVSPTHGTGIAGDTIPLTVHVSGNAQWGQYPISVFVQAKDGWTNAWYGTITVE